MSRNTGIYHIQRLTRKVECVTKVTVKCADCEEPLEFETQDGITRITAARELVAKGWSYRDGDKPRCPEHSGEK